IMAASAIAISSDSSDESVGSPPSRVILFGDIPTVIPSTFVVAPETSTIAPVISYVAPVVSFFQDHHGHLLDNTMSQIHENMQYLVFDCVIAHKVFYVVSCMDD
ncbi:hypothetical protein Tco_0296901, partial [Tanacetum coccineum]